MKPNEEAINQYQDRGPKNQEVSSNWNKFSENIGDSIFLQFLNENRELFTIR